MLEILAIYYFARKVGEIVEAKGYRSGWYKLLAAAFWIFGELAGAVVGVIVTGGNNQCAVYLFAIAGAALGAGVYWYIINNMGTKTPAV